VSGSLNSFKSLVQEVRQCRLCEAHLPLGPNPVFQIHQDARVLIAGQAPGVKVHESGIAFNDASGERLRSWMGLDNATFYDANQIAILPMAFCYPGRGKSGDLPPRPECAPAWREQLLEALPNLKLTLVIGKYAQAWHLPDAKYSTLTSLVQNWRLCSPNIIPLPHPSPRNNIWLKKNPWFEEKLVPQLAKRVQSALK
jgi:uracil-DNA glycosylase